MRLRGFATTTALTGVPAPAGTAGAFAADPAPVTGVAAGSPGRRPGRRRPDPPPHLPVNPCGDSIGIVALLDPAAGDTRVAR
ncbi:chaplin family protein [Streptomyces sp. NPDC012751]|uniref:chaplin family protein n=1 Tax=Streptomyces sp. NPDC012751 TaxID=3364846 RepID=UPI0036C8859E